VQPKARSISNGRENRYFWAPDGIYCPSVTDAGTFEFEAASGIYTELQRGSYICMDADYGRSLDRDGPDEGVRGSSCGRRWQAARRNTAPSSTPTSRRSPSASFAAGADTPSGIDYAASDRVMGGSQ
jgi:hypothetical protein